MLHDEHPREQGYYFLWRLMIDARHQGRGFGLGAIERLLEHLRQRPFAERLLTSCIPGDGSPLPFYLKAGFERTGQQHGDEIELARPVQDARSAVASEPPHGRGG